MSWSQRDTFELIRLYKMNAPLWDLKNASYKNRELKAAIIRSIAASMNVTTNEINRKLLNLRKQVCQELNRSKNKRCRGNSDETSGWIYFSALKFIIPYVDKSRNTDLTIQQSNQRTVRTRNMSHRSENEETCERTFESGLKSPAESVDVSHGEDVKHTSQIVSKVSDEDGRFGEYVALELRSLRSETNKRKLKSEIRKAICRIADLDDADIFVLNTSSDPSPPYSPSSSTNTPVCEIISVKSELI